MSKLDIPESWAQVRLDSVVTIEGGSQPPKSDFAYTEKEGYVRLVQIRDFRTDEFKTYIPKSKARKLFSKDDIMIGRYGPPIFQILRGLEGAYNVALMKASPSTIIDRDYLFYFLKNPKIQEAVEQASVRSAGQSGVNQEFLGAYPITIPPLGEQKRIVARIESTQEKVKTIEQSVTKAEDLIERLALSFLRLNSAVETSISNSFEERVERFGNKDSGTTPMVGVSNEIGVVPLRSEKKVNKTKYKWVNKGDVFYNPMRLNVGSIALYSDETPAITSPDYVVVKPQGHSSGWLLYHFLKSPLGQAEIRKRTKGSVRERVYFQNLASIPFYRISKNESSQIDKCAEKIGSLRKQAKAIVTATKQAGDAILKKAFSGKFVSQDPSEGTGFELLERLELQKAEPDNDKRAKKFKKWKKS